MLLKSHKHSKCYNSDIHLGNHICITITKSWCYEALNISGFEWEVFTC